MLKEKVIFVPKASGSPFCQEKAIEWKARVRAD
jgi:hypothetical protein